MEYIEISPFIPKASVIALGTWQFGDATGTYKKQSEDEEAAIIKAALDAGINFFDTAEAYNNGVSEISLGKALKRSGRNRSEYLIASKVFDHLDYSGVIEACNRSLKHLDTPYIDLYQIHWANREIPLEETTRALIQLKSEGKIKEIGVSNFGPKDLQSALQAKLPFVTNQLPYSLVTRAIEFEILDICVKNKTPILAYSPLAQGLLTGKYNSVEDCPEGISRSRLFHHSRSKLCRHKEEGVEKELFEAISKIKKISERLGKPMATVALAWLLAQKGVGAILVGVSNHKQIATNVDALSLKLDQNTLKELSDATEPLKQKFGSNPDLWAQISRYA